MCGISAGYRGDGSGGGCLHPPPPPLSTSGSPTRGAWGFLPRTLFSSGKKALLVYSRGEHFTPGVDVGVDVKWGGGMSPHFFSPSHFFSHPGGDCPPRQNSVVGLVLRVLASFAGRTPPPRGRGGLQKRAPTLNNKKEHLPTAGKFPCKAICRWIKVGGGHTEAAALDFGE